jgi:hypothetical protein
MCVEVLQRKKMKWDINFDGNNSEEFLILFLKNKQKYVFYALKGEKC